MPSVMIFALCFFALAVLFGFIVFIQHLCQRPSFKPAVIIHGVVAGLGLICLIYYAIQQTGSKLWLSIGVLVLAALGGLTLLNFDLRKKPIPTLILIAHPIAAITGLGLLAYYLIH